LYSYKFDSCHNNNKKVQSDLWYNNKNN
jgi:hypothetical protein